MFGSCAELGWAINAKEMVWTLVNGLRIPHGSCWNTQKLGSTKWCYGQRKWPRLKLRLTLSICCADKGLVSKTQSSKDNLVIRITKKSEIENTWKAWSSTVEVKQLLLTCTRSRLIPEFLERNGNMSIYTSSNTPFIFWYIFWHQKQCIQSNWEYFGAIRFFFVEATVKHGPVEEMPHVNQIALKPTPMGGENKCVGIQFCTLNNCGGVLGNVKSWSWNKTSWKPRIQTSSLLIEWSMIRVLGLMFDGIGRETVQLFDHADVFPEAPRLFPHYANWVQIGSEGAAQLSRGLGLSDDNVKPPDPIRHKAAKAEELCQLTRGKQGERREAESCTQHFV